MTHFPPQVLREPRSQFCEVMVPASQIRNTVVPVEDLAAWINRLARSERCRTWDIEQLRAAEVRMRLAIADEQEADKRARRRAAVMVAGSLVALLALLVWCCWCEWSAGT